MASRLSTLEEIEAALWAALVAAVRDKSHAWRTPVLATVDAGGDEPRADARTVVLREVDVSQRTLTFFTDSRSAKARQLRSHPSAVLVMWSPELSWQLRCDVRLSIAGSGRDVDARWERLKQSPAAQDYMSPLAPGSVLDAEAGLPGHEGYFALVTAAVQSIDWLELNADGHRRAVFEPDRCTWLQP